MPKIILESKFFKCEKHIRNYIQYIARQGQLFSGMQDVDLQDALHTVQKYAGSICWRHIYSLKGEDVERLQIDRDYMKALIESQKNEIAKALHISPEKLILYASYHETAHHPHLHFIMRSKTKSEGFVVARERKDLDILFKPSREKIKSNLANQIFREDLMDIKIHKATIQKELNEQTRTFLKLGKHTHPLSKPICEGLYDLAHNLSKMGGRKVYGYLPADVKQQVDSVLQMMVETNPNLNSLFLQYQNRQQELVSTYADHPETVFKKMQNWEDSFFHPKKGEDSSRHNLIIQYALTLKPQPYKKNVVQMVSYEQSTLQEVAEGIQVPLEQTESSENVSVEPMVDYQQSVLQEVQKVIQIPLKQTEPSEEVKSTEQYKEKISYHHKSNQDSIRSLLYHIGVSLQEDHRRLLQAEPYPKPKLKHKVKKIRKNIEIDAPHIEISQ